MSFRKRNVGLTPGRGPNTSGGEAQGPSDGLQKKEAPVQVPGVRPSPSDGRPTISTGTLSLDFLLAGHAGLPLGNSILIEESGTTDYAGTLLRYLAAEGVVQKHKVHVVGMSEAWGRDLPGVVGVADANTEKQEESTKSKESMKIAWRYEKLGNTGQASQRVPVQRDTSLVQESGSSGDQLEAQGFCHNFDLTKRLTLPSPDALRYIPIRPGSPTSSPFPSILASLEQELAASPPASVHRLLIPSLLSPALYPPQACIPQHILPFLHSLKALLRKYPARLSVMISLPVTLYPRERGLTRWMELLSDSVLELTPFPHTVDTGPTSSTSAQEEKPQGMAKIHRLPVFHERGGGGTGSAGVGDDLAFTVTRKRFAIKPFSLPPMEGDTEAQKGDSDGKPTKVDIDF